MEQKRISFTELRSHYKNVKEFLSDYIGVESSQIGIYAALNDDLQICDEDIFFMGDDFAKAFDIEVEEEDIEDNSLSLFTSWFTFITLILALFLLISPLFFYPLQSLLFLVGLIFFIWVTTFFSSEPVYFKPNKKQWNPDVLTVADMVCMAVEKKVVRKKDIFFVIEKTNFE